MNWFEKMAMILIAVIWLEGGSAHGQDANKRGGDLMYAEDEPAGSFNPYDMSISIPTSDRIFSLIYEPLVRYDVDRNVFAHVLAETSYIAPDRKKITFMLRKNVLWHDGTPFTAADVKFTYEYLQTKERFKRKYSHITAMNEEGPYTIHFVFTSAQAEPLVSFTRVIIPRHRFGEHFTNLVDKPLHKVPIGTGAYAFRNMTLDLQVGLSLNDTYWSSPANLFNLDMIPFVDPEGKKNSLTFGRVGLIVELDAKYIAEFAQQRKFITKPYSSFSFDALAYNFQHALLRDVTVRRAMTMALNRKSLLETWYFGKGEELAGPIVSLSPYYYADLRPLPYDPVRASAMLDSAGYRDVDSDGIRERVTDKTKMKFTLVVPVDREAQSTSTQQVANSFAEAMSKIGIAITMEHLNRDVYDQRMLVERTFDIIWVRWEFDAAYNIRDLFDSREIYPQGKNCISYKDPLVEDLIKRFANASDPAYRVGIMHALQQKLRDDCPYTFLYSINYMAVYHYRLQLSRIDPYYFFTFLPEWYIPAEWRH